MALEPQPKLHGSRRLFYAALAVAIAAVATRVPSLFASGCITTDDYVYSWVGRNIIMGRGITDYHGPHTMFPPGYPLLIGLVYLVSSNLELAIRLVNLLLGLGTVALVGATAARFWSARVGIFAAMFAALSPSLIRSGFEGGSETAFAFLTMTVVYLAVGAFQGSPASALVCGIGIGAAVLVRPEGGIYLPVALLAVFLLRPRDGWLCTGALVVGTVMFLAPYSAFMHVQTGTFLPTGKLKTLAVDDPTLTSDPEVVLYSLTPDGKRLTGDVVDSGTTISRQKQNLGLFAVKYAKNLARSIIHVAKAVWMPAIFFIPFALLPLSELHKQRAALAASLIPLVVLLAVAAFFIRTRYLLGVIPVALIWSGRGFWILTRLQGRRWTPAVRAGMVVMIALWAVATGISGVRISITDRLNESPEHVAAGLWLREQGLTGDPVMSRKPFVPFYADSPWEIVPLAEYERTIAFARSRQVRFLIIDERWAGKMRPELTFLLDPANAPPELRPLKVFNSGPDGRPTPRLVIYELRDEG